MDYVSRSHGTDAPASTQDKTKDGISLSKMYGKTARNVTRLTAWAASKRRRKEKPKVRSRNLVAVRASHRDPMGIVETEGYMEAEQSFFNDSWGHRYYARRNENPGPV